MKMRGKEIAETFVIDKSRNAIGFRLTWKGDVSHKYEITWLICCLWYLFLLINIPSQIIVHLPELETTLMSTTPMMTKTIKKTLKTTTTTVPKTTLVTTTTLTTTLSTLPTSLIERTSQPFKTSVNSPHVTLTTLSTLQTSLTKRTSRPFTTPASSPHVSSTFYNIRTKTTRAHKEETLDIRYWSLDSCTIY